MQFGCLKYWTTNLGDEIQSLAVLNFLPRHVRFVDRDHVPEQADEELFLICHGWWMHARAGSFRFPLPSSVRPLFSSLHLTPVFQERVTTEALEYLREYGPVGCRDFNTLRFLERQGVPAYFSGCVTATLGLFESQGPQRTTNVCLVDVAPWAVDQVPRALRQRAIWRTHHFPRIPSPDWDNVSNLAERHAIARRLLSTYRQASLIITGRLHCALPAMALGTPVIFVPRNPSDPRYEGLEELLPIYKPGDSIDWDPRPVDLGNQAVPLARMLKAAVAMQGNPVSSPEQFPSNFRDIDVTATVGSRRSDARAADSRGIRSGTRSSAAGASEVVAMFLNQDIKKERTGIENAALLRARLFTTHLGLTPCMVTAHYDAHFAANREALVRNGRLHPDTAFLNIYDYFQDRDGSELPANRGTFQFNRQWRCEPVANTADARIYNDAGDLLMYIKTSRQTDCLEYVNYFFQRKMWRRDTFTQDGVLSRIQYLEPETRQALFECYLRPDGSIAVVHLFAGEAGNRQLVKISLLNRNGCVHDFASREEWIGYWLDCLTQDQEKRFLLFADKNRLYYPGLRKLKATPGKSHVRVIPVIHAVHTKNGFDVERSGVNNNYADVLHNMHEPDAIVVATEQQKSDIIARFGTGNIWTIPPAYSEPPPQPIPFSARARKRLVYVGRYSPEKQQAVAVQAFARVLARIPDAELHFYGSGSGKKGLEDLIQELALHRSVFVHPFAADVESIYRSAGLSLLTSTGEGYSLVVMESLSQGCPVVAFDVKYGPSDMIRHRENGMLVPFGDEEAFANRIVDILQDVSLHERLSSNALHRSRDFGANQIASRWAELLAELVEKRSSA